VTATEFEIERRPLGSSDVTLPRVALGCGNFGGVGSAPAFFGQGLSEDEAFAVMDAAWELGLDHFDTADAYGGGRSEQMIGRWIAARGLLPTITSKTFNPMDAGADHGLAPARIARQLDSSLERLGVERIELYLAHDYDPGVALAETLGAFEQHRVEGRIEAYGVSNFDAAQLADALATPCSPGAVQNPYSLLDRGDGGDDGVLALCDEAGVAYCVFSPLAGGWLTGKYRRGEPYPAGSRMSQRPEPYREFESGRIHDALERLDSYSRGRGMSMAGVALAWLLADERVAQVVIGPVAPEHLEPLREALTQPLNDSERQLVEEMFL
jgi:aryl-alcohol dehydrogenase-like predicted oxidoreductase